jgi:hypothetical protein
VETLVRTATDFFAAIFARVGFVGRPRRRAYIRDDLTLLAELRETQEFGPTSRAHANLVEYINSEVALYSGVGVKSKAWGSFWIAVVLGVPLALLAYNMDKDGWNWLSLLPALPAAFFLIGALGIAFGTEDDEEDAQQDGASPSA